MNKLKKLQKNIDNKLLTINHIGSRGEGISNLTTEINYKESNHTFFIPFINFDICIKNFLFIIKKT